MPQIRDPHVYRAYRIDSHGRFGGVEIIDAKDDKSAFALIRSMSNDHGMELWDRARFLGVVPPRVSAAA